MEVRANIESDQTPLQNHRLPSRRSRVKEAVVTSLLKWFPRPFGPALRRQFYHAIFARMGKAVYIQDNVEILGAKSIEIEDEVKILSGTCLNGYAPNSKIILRKGVCLDRGVDFRVVTYEGNCTIEVGEGTGIGPYTCIAGPGHVKIGKFCLIASHVGIYANQHIFNDPTCGIMTQGIIRKGIAIEDDCWLGTGVKVLDGVTIGRGSVIGAGAVVTKSIPPYSVAVGVPAKVISRRGDKKLTNDS